MGPWAGSKSLEQLLPALFRTCCWGPNALRVMLAISWRELLLETHSHLDLRSSDDSSSHLSNHEQPWPLTLAHPMPSLGTSKGLQEQEGRERGCLPGRGSHHHLPVVAAAVDEDIACCTIAPCPAEPLGRVALLQGALILLHLQPVVGDLQLLVSHLGVQLKRLTC